MIKNKDVLKNSVYLYLLTFVKIGLPLVTLPYLTRVLSVECYGMTVYIKSCMAYIQILVDFGFMLSATREVVGAQEDKAQLGRITGSVIYAKLMLAAAGLFAVLCMLLFMEMLRGYALYTLLTFAAVAVNGLLPDFLFRGLNRMQEITYRFIVCKALSVALTLWLIKSDGDVLLIPVFDLLSSLVAAALSLIRVRRLGIMVRIGKIDAAIRQLKTSAVYFASNCATTAFGALNTVVVGLFFGPVQVAYWGVAMQLVTAAQSLYTPITDGVFPHMVKTRDLGLIRRILCIFMPLILLACLGCYIGAEWIITLISGAKYAAATNVFRSLIPLLAVSFPAMLLGWPCLGAIDRAAEVTKATITAAVVQVAGMAVLLLCNRFTLAGLALVRTVSEISMLVMRGGYVYRYRDAFKNGSAVYTLKGMEK